MKSKGLITCFLAVAISSAMHAQTITSGFGSGTNYFEIEFVKIGNPGNAADDTGLGAVAYNYNIGKYEVSREMIIKANSVS